MVLESGVSWAHAWFTHPGGSDVGTDSGIVFESDVPLTSVTFTVTGVVPIANGTPPIASFPITDSPPGNPSTVQVAVPEPPENSSVARYLAPATPVGNDDVEIDTAGTAWAPDGLTHDTNNAANTTTTDTNATRLRTITGSRPLRSAHDE